MSSVPFFGMMEAEYLDRRHGQEAKLGMKPEAGEIIN